MSINLFQALILGLFASLSSMPGMGSSSIGNYTLGRPLVGGLVCGLVLGDLKTGILVGVAMQIVYIALVTPGGTVSADVRAVSYIGIPLAMLAIKSQGFLRYGNTQPRLAAYRLESDRKKELQADLPCRPRISVDFPHCILHGPDSYHVYARRSCC